MNNTPKIKLKTHFINPPIPIRCFDFVAWVDGEEETGPYGHGPTEQEAIDNLEDRTNMNNDE